MCVYVCVCVHVPVYVYMCMCVHVCVHVRVCASAQANSAEHFLFLMCCCETVGPCSHSSLTLSEDSDSRSHSAS